MEAMKERFSGGFLLSAWHQRVIAAALIALLTLSLAGCSEDEEPKWHTIDVRKLVCSTPKPDFIQVNIHDYGDKEEAYALTFVRSFEEDVKIEFGLNDAKGTQIVPPQTVDLVKQSGLAIQSDDTRRLQLQLLTASGGELQPSPDSVESEMRAQTSTEDDVHLNQCELFFLFEGRSPLELPETWEEARTAYQEMCAAEGFQSEACHVAEQNLFDGYPRGNETMVADDALCSKLMEHAEVLMHLHVGEQSHRPDIVPLTNVNGSLTGNAPARRTKSWGESGAGYKKDKLKSNYPGGWNKAGYGYAGPVAVGVVGGAAVGMLVVGGATDVNVYRDDLMEEAFVPADYTYPLVLTIYSVKSSGASCGGTSSNSKMIFGLSLAVPPLGAAFWICMTIFVFAPIGLGFLFCCVSILSEVCAGGSEGGGSSSESDSTPMRSM
jgi:hypothetical protein